MAKQKFAVGADVWVKMSSSAVKGGVVKAVKSDMVVVKFKDGTMTVHNEKDISTDIHKLIGGRLTQKDEPTNESTKSTQSMKKSIPLKGHAYHRKSDEELRYIIKDAGEAARAMKDHSPASEAKYLDQVNDACTVLHYRKNGGVREVSEISATTLTAYAVKARKDAAEKEKTGERQMKSSSPKTLDKAIENFRAASKRHQNANKAETKALGKQMLGIDK